MARRRTFSSWRASSDPLMKSESALCELSLAVKMKSSPASTIILATGCEQIVAEKDWAQRGEPRAVRGQPAFDGVALAILLFGAVLGRDQLGHQGDDLGMAGRHDGGRQQAMIALGLAVGALAGQTIRAGELLRAEIFRSVPGDERPSAQPAEGLPQGGPGQQRLDAFETGPHKRGVGLVQRVADIIVRRNSADPEKGLAIGAPLALFQRALKGKKRRALHEKHRESRKTEVRDLDIAATPLSRVGKRRAYGLQAGQKGGQKLHPNHESDFC